MKTEVFCSFCSLPHKVYKKKHIGPIEFLSFAGLCVWLSYWVWQSFHWAAMLLFAVLSLACELGHRVRWRDSVKCRHCGFDACLYKQTPDVAAQVVKEFLAQRREDPSYLLKPRPQIKPIVKRKASSSPRQHDAIN